MTAPRAPRFLLHDSPVGDILIVTDGGGIIALHPVHGAPDADLHAIEALTGAAPVFDDGDPTACAAAEQIDEYFSGDRRSFDLPLDWSRVRGFTGEALRAVCDIPYGETAGYGEVAIAAGSPRAARAVGTACATTPFSIVVPVHRVVRADGSLGEYGGHSEVKQHLIDFERRVAAEGVAE
ncbi:methylated-DNA-[protein]-cysteine S-methyltransferase [Microbacterium terrae]|uniref:methylated-DNA--[protein]-cysteine S-methyltransferase n=1 Tax=Microbacterium terrae TaxID=69369 RepID=A0A0M2HKI7_9MICO|nr:methylated-DNA--[protein]-cysteine S-methyltransferase [Microbacterium terrae]KJL44906.1 Methylated-DNA--protein-cysteine methyltransferase [Microbacterium terrae]MBP1076758.1 methylated-DNA-[protein]-cysteine S-methyltransferase [Microbacterium terrae]GLJ97589.1 methylated-DNA--protein-cysteine methyltransferase [Microbacterium terrae]